MTFLLLFLFQNQPLTLAVTNENGKRTHDDISVDYLFSIEEPSTKFHKTDKTWHPEHKSECNAEIITKFAHVNWEIFFSEIIRDGGQKMGSILAEDKLKSGIEQMEVEHQNELETQQDCNDRIIKKLQERCESLENERNELDREIDQLKMKLKEINDNSIEMEIKIEEYKKQIETLNQNHANELNGVLSGDNYYVQLKNNHAEEIKQLKQTYAETMKQYYEENTRLTMVASDERYKVKNNADCYQKQLEDWLVKYEALRKVHSNREDELMKRLDAMKLSMQQKVVTHMNETISLRKQIELDKNSYLSALKATSERQNITITNLHSEIENQKSIYTQKLNEAESRCNRLTIQLDSMKHAYELGMPEMLAQLKQNIMHSKIKTDVSFTTELPAVTTSDIPNDTSIKERKCDQCKESARQLRKHTFTYCSIKCKQDYM